MILRRISIFVTAAASILLTLVGASAAPPDGGFLAQAEAGRAQYAVKCALCHGAQLEGGVAPTLKGATFVSAWGDAGRLHKSFSESMPPAEPGKLGGEAYLELLAYILAANGVTPPGPLTKENAAQLSLAATGGALSVPAAAVATATGPAAEPVSQAFTWDQRLPTLAPGAQGAPIQSIGQGLRAQTYGRVAAARRPYRPVSAATILNPPPEEWLMWRRTVDNQGYSPLARIDRDNVQDLELAWAWPMSENGQQETAPLVHDGIMFLGGNHGIVQALDAVTGELIWEYRHLMAVFPDSWGYMKYQPRRQRNSIALYEDKVILTTADAKIVSIEAATGKMAWEVQAFDPTKGYSYTAGPLVAAGKIFTGTSGCSVAGTEGGCFIAAHDAATGRALWRFNILDDPGNQDQQASWGKVPPLNRWGGSAWTTGAYDPRTNTLFWGTGMPAPYPELVRGSGAGEVLYTNNTLALDADTGQRRWNFSHLPRDNWDQDHPFERVLVDEEIGGQLRRLLVTVPGKPGVAFVLHRDDGNFVWARETIYQNVIKSIDPITGRVEANTDLIFTALNQELLICPSIHGGRVWQAGAYSPLTRTYYLPIAESCNVMAASATEFTKGNIVGSAKSGPRVLPDGIDRAGVLEAFRVADGARLWRNEQRAIFTSSLLATGGGLVFGGDSGRYLKALDQWTGKVLWQQRLNAPIAGFPMTYEIAGVQYLAIPTGYNSQAASAAPLHPEIPVPSGFGNSIFVFKLRNQPASRPPRPAAASAPN